MKKPLYISTNPQGVTAGFFTVNKTDVNGNKPPSFDFVANEYPEDYIRKNDKYTIAIVNDLPEFTVRPDWDLYENYLFNFVPANDEDFPLSYENWFSAQ